MKLYSEKQIIEMLNRARLHKQDDTEMFTNEYLLSQETPIELLIDEEIQEKSKYWNEITNPNMFTFKLAWENGAIRLKKQILNQNK